MGDRNIKEKIIWREDSARPLFPFLYSRNGLFFGESKSFYSFFLFSAFLLLALTSCARKGKKEKKKDEKDEALAPLREYVQGFQDSWIIARVFSFSFTFI